MRSRVTYRDRQTGSAEQFRAVLFRLSDEACSLKVNVRVLEGVRLRPKKLSLLEDIKRTVKYDSRVHPAMYMRKHRPPPNPFAVCLSFRENDDYTHTEVKDILESQIGLKIRSVQYDPLSIRSSDPDVGSRWIVMYATPAECEFATSKGLEMNGDKIAIKLLDDVINCECEAYILHKEEERQRRIAEEAHVIFKDRKRQKKEKVCSSTQT